METKNKLVIIDSNSVIHRAFHALPPLTTKKNEPVGAVYGFLLVFLKAVKEFQPNFIAACFDVKGPTFRHEKYAQYKAQRPKAPDELYQQIPIVKKVLSDFGVPVYEKQGFEADDLIGTIARIASQSGSASDLEIIIVSGDSDNFQMINPQIGVYALRKGVKDTILYNEARVAEKYQGLKPIQLIDYRALRGDATDNIPGVKGIGEKTAIDLLQRFGNLENIYQKIEEVKPKTRELLSQHKEDALMSKDLATIDQRVPMDFKLEDCRWLGYDNNRARESLESFGFYSLITRLFN